MPLVWVEDDEWFPSRMLHGVEELELIGDHMFTLGVPQGSPEEFRWNVFAAAKAYNLGNRIDYTLKRYGDRWDFSEYENAGALLTRDVSYAVRREVQRSVRAIKTLSATVEPLESGLFAATVALIRLEGSFRAAVLLNRHGFFLEAAGILRLILEQLAWAHSIHRIDGDSFFKVQPDRCISNLKSIAPYAGRLYGALSDWTHIAPEQTVGYLEITGSRIEVNQTSEDKAKINVLYLMALVDLMAVVVAVISFPHTPMTDVVQISDSGELSPRDDRPTRTILSTYRDRLLSEAPTQHGA